MVWGPETQLIPEAANVWCVVKAKAGQNAYASRNGSRTQSVQSLSGNYTVHLCSLGHQAGRLSMVDDGGIENERTARVQQKSEAELCLLKEWIEGGEKEESTRQERRRGAAAAS